MKIALLHFRVGFTDGVSLEMEKWKTVLERMGHEVLYVAGEFSQISGVEIPTLAMNDPTNIWIHRNAFEKLLVSDETFLKVFKDYVRRIEEELERKVPPLDILIVNNILSLGFNLAAAVAISEYAKSRNIKVVGHHHDFYWERERYSRPQSEFVVKILNRYFPPKGENFFHITINTLAQKELFRRKGIESLVVPNIFDFDQPLWKIDEYNKDLRPSLGISDGDIVILHATRIVQRKAIELALDFVECFCKLSERKVHFLLAGFPEQESQEYYRKIVEKAKKMPYTTHFVFDIVRAERFLGEKKYYSLWDMYAVADAITYTSALEGWGNQLIEAVFSKKPLVVFEYPVFKSDIAPLGFDFISLGDEIHYDENESLYKIDQAKIEKAAEKLKWLLSHPEELSKVVEKNFQIGKKHLSLEKLQQYLTFLFNRLGLSTG
ncbi:glycosyltransferase [Pseudothermotoga sp.]|nr:glycosyltransferase family 4 protein [Pseudothermotoga sp.]MDW8140553.1 glycosyltransferase family 4 protein [Pseudothermotoga sp.]